MARFLGGVQPVNIVSKPVPKRWDLSLSVPVPDMAALGGANEVRAGSLRAREATGNASTPVLSAAAPTTPPSAAPSTEPSAESLSAPATPLEDAIGVFPRRTLGRFRRLPGTRGRNRRNGREPPRRSSHPSTSAPFLARRSLRGGRRRDGGTRRDFHLAPRAGTHRRPYREQPFCNRLRELPRTRRKAHRRAQRHSPAPRLAKRGISSEDYAAGISGITEIPPLARATTAPYPKNSAPSSRGRSGRNPALRGGHQLPRAGHRHGPRGPRHQVAAPPLGRLRPATEVGRADHRVGEISRGVFYPSTAATSSERP